VAIALQGIRGFHNIRIMVLLTFTFLATTEIPAEAGILWEFQELIINIKISKSNIKTQFSK
jgi:hypothetical protein